MGEKESFNYSEVLKRLENLSDCEVFDHDSNGSFFSLQNGSSLTQSDPNLPSSPVFKNLSSQSSFFSEFNSRYKTNISTIPELFISVDELYRKSKTNNEQSEEFERVRSQLENRIAKYKYGMKTQANHVIELENSIAEQSSALTRAKSQIEELLSEKQILDAKYLAQEQALTSSSAIIKNLQKEIEIKRNGSGNVLSAINAIQSSIESNAKEAISLTTQRNKLAEIVGKQNRLIEALQSIPPRRETVYVDRPIEADFNSLLEDICAIAMPTQTAINAHNISKLRDNSSIPPKQRILEILKIILKPSETSNPEMSSIKRKLDFAERRQERMVQILRDEVDFLSQLTSREDVRSIVFSTADMSQTLRSRLSKKCGELGEFLENAVPRQLLDSAFNSIGANTKADAVRIFDLIRPREIISETERVLGDGALERECPDLFFLYISQTLVSCILQQFASSTASANSLLQRENEKLRLLMDEKSSAQKELMVLKQRDSKIRAMLDGVFEASAEADTASIVESALKYLRQQCREAAKVQKLEKSLLQLRKDTSSKIFDAECKYKENVEKIKKGFETRDLEAQAKLQSLTFENRKLSETSANVKKENEDLRRRVDILVRDSTQLENTTDEKISSLTRENNSLTSQINELSASLRAAESKCGDLHSRSRAMKRDNERLQHRIKELESVQDSASEVVRVKTASIRAEYDDALSSIKSQMQKTTESFVKVKEELEKVRAEKSELEAKAATSSLENTTLNSKLSVLEQRLSAQEVSDSMKTKFVSFVKALESHFGRRYPDSFDGALQAASEDLAKDNSASILKQILEKVGAGSEGEIIDVVDEMVSQRRSFEERIGQLQSSIAEIVAVQKRLSSDIDVWTAWGREMLGRIGASDSSSLSPDSIRRILSSALIDSSSSSSRHHRHSSSSSSKSKSNSKAKDKDKSKSKSDSASKSDKEKEKEKKEKIETPERGRRSGHHSPKSPLIPLFV